MAKKILIVTTVDRPREYTANLKNIFEEDLGLETKITDLESLAFFCRNGKVDISIDSESIDNYSAVYIKHWHAAEEAAFVLTHYAIRHGIAVIPSECSRIVPKTKFGETFYMALNDLPVPDSIYFASAQTYLTHEKTITDLLGDEFIFKAADGKKGSDNYLIKSHAQLQDVLRNTPNQVFIAQRFIENDGDYRIINFGNELKIAIHRTREEGTHLNNTSQGGDGELIRIEDVRHDVRDIALKAASLFGRDIAGIDVVIGKDGHAYLFEVNYSPQLTTGTYLEVKREYLADYFRKIIQG
jgi:glutathione synthase/RimK-type ligase-like ATP-grasp enzyme